MRRADPRDAVALLAAVCGLGLLALARHAPAGLAGLHRFAAGLPGWLTAHPLLPAAVLAALAACALARWAAMRRVLRSRETVAVVPADSFDPSADAVAGFAGQLARARRPLLGRVDEPASAVTIQLVRQPDAPLVRYQLTAPARAMPVVQSALGGYSDLTVQPVPAAPAAETSAVRRRAVRAELVLARSSAESLREPGLDPDPLQPLAAVLAALEDDEGAVLALGLQPVTPGQRRRMRRSLARRARRETGEPGTLASLLNQGRTQGGRANPVDLIERRARTQALAGKLGSPQPLFRMQLLLRVEGPSRGRAIEHLRALLSCTDAMAAENHLRVVGLRLGGLGFLGSDLPWRRRGFDRRIRTGLFRPRRRSVVSAAEIAGLLKPPTVHCQVEAVERSGGLIAPAPAGLPEFTGQRDLVPLGEIDTPAGRRRVGVPADRTIFSYMAGRSRWGKTETALGQFVHLVRAGHGGLFLDPHSDALAKMKRYLTDPGVRERVVEIDLADLAGRHGQPGWNLFATHGLPAWESDRRVDAVVDAFAAALGWDETNTRALNLITQSAQAMTELARALPPELAPTIFQVPTLLSNETWRQAVLPHIAPATRQFFQDRFPRLPAEAITPVTNLIDRLHAARPVAALLGSPTSTFDMRAAMDQGLIVLACPGTGSTRDRLMANLLVYEVLHAARTRTDQDPSRRRVFWLALDELQTYDGPNLPVLLEQSAKFAVRALLMNQNPERLTAPTLNAVATNRSHLLATAVSAKAAGWLSREYGGQPEPHTITRLARYTYLASVTLGDRPSDPFLVHGLPVHALHGEHHRPDRLGELDAAIDRTMSRTPVDQTLAQLADHDQRILEHLAPTLTAAGRGSEQQGSRLPDLDGDA